MVYGLLRALPGVPGLLAPVACQLVIGRLDPSVGGSGPHGLTVRFGAHHLTHQQRPSHPALDVRDDRDAPSCERGMGRHIRLFPDFGKKNMRAGQRALFLNSGRCFARRVVGATVGSMRLACR
jgi:hypothetical protein